jgi:putative endonuclease
MYCVYLLQNQDGGWYIGFTGDLKRRISEHHSGQSPTTSRGRYRLVYYEGYLNKADAMGRERFLKSGSGRKYLQKQLTHFLTEGAGAF